MAIFCLAISISDLKEKSGWRSKIVCAYTYEDKPVRPERHRCRKFIPRCSGCP